MERSKEEEGMDPIQIGKLRYRQKDYEGSLSAFSEAVRISSGHLLIDAIDHRAAAYEKLGKLQAALKDSKQMIDFRPNIAKGYLRCAKVLQLRGDTALALKIYERGLTKVKVGTDEDRHLLQKLFNKLNAQQGPKVNFNPLVMLPTELAQMVCSYLSSTDLVACLRVHSSWKRFLESQHSLWDVLDTSAVKMNITEAALKKFLSRSNYSLHSAIIKMIKTEFNANKFKILLKNCKKLKCLELRQGIIGATLVNVLPLAKNLKTLILEKDTKLTLHCITQVLAASPNLATAEFHNVDPGGDWVGLSSIWRPMPSLETLVIKASPGPRSELLRLSLVNLNLDQLILATPNLKVVRLSRWQTLGLATAIDFSLWQHLEELSIEDVAMHRITGLPQHLQILDLRELSNIDHIEMKPTDQNETEITILPNLTSLDCTNTDYFNIEKTFEIISTSIASNKLKILRCGEKLTGFHIDDFRPSPSLEELSLRAFQVSEDTIISILRKYPALKRVDLSRTKVTGVTVKELMTRETGTLEWLDLSDCMEVSPDAVDYARAKGAHVERRFTSQRVGFRDRNR